MLEFIFNGSVLIRDLHPFNRSKTSSVLFHDKRVTSKINSIRRCYTLTESMFDVEVPRWLPTMFLELRYKRLETFLVSVLLQPRVVNSDIERPFA